MTEVARPTQEPSLAIYGDELIRQALTRLNAHAVGRIETFNRLKQSAEATIGYRKTLANGNTAAYPPLVDCPVLFLGGGSGALTFPVQAGDDCLVLFNDRNMDDWITAGQVTVPDVERLHGFQDALIIVGFRPFCRPLSGFLANGTELRQGTTSIQLTSKVKIANATTDLRTLLNGLIDLVSTMVGQITPTTGMTAGNIAANQAALAAYKTTIAGLLT